MPAAILGDVLRGDLEIGLRDPHLQAGCRAVVHPLVHVVGAGSCATKPLPMRRDLRRRAAKNLPQRLLFYLEVVLRGDFLRNGQVMASLRVVGVRNRGGADFEVALGLRELFSERGFLRAGERHVVLGQQTSK